MPLHEPPAAVDLFCGAGGLSFGMREAGIKIAAGIDVDPDCRHPFENNVNSVFHEKDISTIDSAFVNSLFPENSIKILAGCAPCQPYSPYAHKHSSKDQRWQLLGKFGTIVRELRPEIVTMENVPQVQKHDIFRDFIRALEETGYGDPYVATVDCSQYGVPQSRKRLVVLATLHGDIKLIEPPSATEDIPTVRSFINELEEIEAGSASEADPLHMASRLSEKNLERIRSSRPGGTWRDWPKDLRAECHTKDTGSTYSCVYGRMQWEKPSPTLTTQFIGFGNGRFGHPDQDRAISLREGSLLQTFPVDYSFVPEGTPVMISKVATMIGNAVPVKLGEAIGSSILAHLKLNP